MLRLVNEYPEELIRHCHITIQAALMRIIDNDFCDRGFTASVKRPRYWFEVKTQLLFSFEFRYQDNSNFKAGIFINAGNYFDNGWRSNRCFCGSVTALRMLFAITVNVGTNFLNVTKPLPMISSSTAGISFTSLKTAWDHLLDGFMAQVYLFRQI